MDAWTLTRSEARWIERCAQRLKELDATLAHQEAVRLAFDLVRVWPRLQPFEAAEAYVAPLKA